MPRPPKLCCVFYIITNLCQRSYMRNRGKGVGFDICRLNSLIPFSPRLPDWSHTQLSPPPPLRHVLNPWEHRPPRPASPCTEGPTNTRGLCWLTKWRQKYQLDLSKYVQNLVQNQHSRYYRNTAYSGYLRNTTHSSYTRNFGTF